MPGVRALVVLSAAVALVAGASMWPGVHGGVPKRSGSAAAQLAMHRAAPARPAVASRRTPPPVPKLVSPRRGAALHLTFPRTWRPVTLEVGSPVQKPPLRVFCATCPPGTVLAADL